MRIRLIFLSLLLCCPLLSSFSSPASLGGDLYKDKCAKCHGINRMGLSGPPLIPEFLKSKSDNTLFKIIKNGLPPTLMPSFKDLTDKQIESLIAFIKTPVAVNTWSLSDIRKTLHKLSAQNPKPWHRTIVNFMALVEAGKNKVWFLNKTHVINKINFGDIHGGLKFSNDGKFIYIPSRTGYIGRYNIRKGYLDYKVKACLYQRNVSLFSNGVISACWLPSQIVILNKKLEPKAVIPIDGKISAIYGLYNSPYAVFGLMHKSVLGFLNTSSLNLKYYNVPTAFEDFFIDPLEHFVVGTSFNHNVLSVFDIKSKKIVYQTAFGGMPHLASAAFWYKDKNFYFATPDLKKPVITIWRAYKWIKIKEIPSKGVGFFVKTNPNTPYLWADEHANTILLIKKTDFKPIHVKLVKKGWIIHTQFSGDGKYAYVSDYAKNGNVFILDSTTLKLIKSFPASYPIGKYNYVTYSNRREAALLGEEVYLQYCWGCHHPTRTAFAPSFKYIAKHIPISLIKAQILNPDQTYKLLGFKQNVMPKFHLSKYEIDALLMFIEYSKNRNFWDSH